MIAIAGPPHGGGELQYSVTQLIVAFARFLAERTQKCLMFSTLGFGSLLLKERPTKEKPRIIPSGRTKTIQPFETGVVRAIHVRDGQSVRPATYSRACMARTTAPKFAGTPDLPTESLGAPRHHKLPIQA
jgi:hypothetical protein